MNYLFDFLRLFCSIFLKTRCRAGIFSLHFDHLDFFVIPRATIYILDSGQEKCSWKGLLIKFFVGQNIQLIKGNQITDRKKCWYKCKGTDNFIKRILFSIHHESRFSFHKRVSHQWIFVKVFDHMKRNECERKAERCKKIKHMPSSADTQTHPQTQIYKPHFVTFPPSELCVHIRKSYPIMARTAKAMKFYVTHGDVHFTK